MSIYGLPHVQFCKIKLRTGHESGTTGKQHEWKVFIALEMSVVCGNVVFKCQVLCWDD